MKWWLLGAGVLMVYIGAALFLWAASISYDGIALVANSGLVLFGVGALLTIGALVALAKGAPRGTA